MSRKTKERVKKANCQRYHNDEEYKEYCRIKGNRRNKAIKILIDKHRKEFDKIYGDLK